MQGPEETRDVRECRRLDRSVFGLRSGRPAVDIWAAHRTSLWTVGGADAPVAHRSPSADALHVDNDGVVAHTPVAIGDFDFFEVQ